MPDPSWWSSTAPAAAPAPGAAPAGAAPAAPSGASVPSWWGGGGATPAATPQVAQAGVGGGGAKGVLGWFGRLGSGALKAAENAPAGIAKLGGDIGKQAVTDFKIGFTGAKPQPLSQAPAFTDVTAPVVNTGRYVGGGAQALGLVPGHGLSDQLHQDFYTNPFAGILNVASTAALVAGPAEAGLSRAAEALPTGSAAATIAGGAAKGAGAVGAVANPLSNLPNLPWTIPYRLASEGLSPTAESVLGHLPAGGAVVGAADRIHQGYVNRTQAANIDLRGKILENTGRGDVANAVMRAQQAVAGNPAEFGAAVASLRNETGLIGTATDTAIHAPTTTPAITPGEGFPTAPSAAPVPGLTPAEYQRAMAETFKTAPNLPAEQQVTPEMAHLAEGLRTGTLPADQAARIQAAAQILREGEAAPRQQIELSGTNRLKGAGLNPEQTGFTPLSQVVEDRSKAADTAAAQAQVAAVRAEKVAADANARRGITPGSASKPTFEDRTATKLRADATSALQEADQVRKAAATSPEAIPNRLVPAINRAQAFADSLRVQAEAAGSAGDLASAARLHQVADTIPTTLEQAAAAHGAGTFQDPTHLISGRLAPPRGTGGVSPYTPLTGRGTVGAAHQGGRENLLVGTTPKQFADTAMRRRAEAAHNANIREAVSHPEVGVKPADVGVTGLTGAKLVAAMKAQPGELQPFNPANTFTKGRIVNDAQVTPDTMFVRKGLLDALQRRETVHNIGPNDIVGRGFDQVTKWLYRKPLSVEPTMMVRRAATSGYKAFVNADVSPAEIVRRGPEIIRNMHDRTFVARAAQQSGMFGDEKVAVGKVDAKSGVVHNIGQALTAARRGAQWVDQAVKVAVSLHDMENGMLPEAAAAHAVQTVGVDWGNLSPATRAITARLFPIAPFIKSVGMAAAKFGVDHPIMQAYVNNLGLTASENPQIQGLPSWLKGALPAGAGKYISLNNLYPPSLLTSVGTPGGFVNPVVKTAVETGTGLNPNTMGQISRPGGAFGKPPTGHPAQLSEDAYIALKNNPLGKQVLSQVLPNVARYGTGEPILGKAGPTVYSGTPNLSERLLTLLGSPITKYTPSPKAAKSAVTAAKADQTYANRLKQFGAKTQVPGLGRMGLHFP